MKYLILLLLVSATVNVNAQNIDSLTQRILKLELNQNHIQLNLAKSHKQFSTGSTLLLIGALATGAYIHSLKSQDEMPILLAVGSGMALAGGVIQIDSHKWIGKGGRKRK